MRVLWWSGLVILLLGVVRSVAFLVDGVAAGDAATIAVNAALLPVEGALVIVLWRIRGQLRISP